MKKITAKFNSICAENGKKIKKGEQMVYDYANRKPYHLTSNKAQELDIDHNTANMVQANEEAYFDNFCHNNNI